MDYKKIVSSKLNFIKNYLQSGRCLTILFDWFYVSVPISDRDNYGHQSFRIVDLFKELKEANISVEVSQKTYIFKMC